MDDVHRESSGAKREAMKRMPRVLLVTFLFMGSNDLTVDLGNSFQRALVGCELLHPIEDVCPVGSKLLEATSEVCQPLPRGDVDWSGSGNCADKKYVMNTGVKLSGRLIMVDGIMGLLAVVFLGALIDSWGRKPVCIIALCGSFCRVALWLIAPSLKPHEFNAVIAGEMLSSGSNAFGPAVKAMAADLSPPNEEARAAAFAALEVVKSISVLLSFGLGYFILEMDLEDYHYVWASSTVYSLMAITVAVLCVQETRTSHSDGVISEEDGLTASRCPCARRGIEDVRMGLRAVMADAFLARFMVVQFIFGVVLMSFFMTLRPLMITYLGCSQATASLVGVINPACAMVGIGLVAPISRRTGPHFVLALGLTLMAFALAGTGFLPLLGSLRIFWILFFFASVGLGMFSTAMPTIISVRVAEESQGTVFALFEIVSDLAMFIVPSIVSSLFDTERTGLGAGQLYFVIAVVLLIDIAVFLFATWRTAAPESSDFEDSCSESGTDDEGFKIAMDAAR